MLILKILGLLDIIAAIIFWIYGIFQIEFLSSFILILGFIMLIKGVSFSLVSGLDLISIGDAVIGLLIIATSQFFLPKIIVIIISLFLLQKGVFSIID